MNEKYMKVVLLADHLNELLQAEHFEAAKLTSRRLLGEVNQFQADLIADIESRKPQPVPEPVVVETPAVPPAPPQPADNPV